MGFGSGGATLCQVVCVGVKLGYVPGEGISACFEAGFVAGSSAEIDPFAGLADNGLSTEAKLARKAGIANVEVGVDVPNATIMLIENAELFGLAQLHQLRGRIGRGAHDSYCILVSAAKTKEARHRLKVLEDTNDGFRIAEADLKLRGPGELLGQQQSGAPRFRFGNLVEDLDLITQARKVAGELVAGGP